MLYYRLGDSGFEDEDFGGAINEEMLQIWVRGLLANNSESVIDMDKVCDIVKTVICAECQSERSRKPSKRFLRGVRHASSVDFACEPICLTRSPSSSCGRHRSRSTRDSQQTDISFFDSGIGLDSDAGICDISSCDEDGDFFSAGSKDDACDDYVTCGQCKDDICDNDATSGLFVQPVCVVIIPRHPVVIIPRHPVVIIPRQPVVIIPRQPVVIIPRQPVVIIPRQPMDYSRPPQPRDYSRCRSLQEPPRVGVKQWGKRPSSCSPPVGGYGQGAAAEVFYPIGVIGRPYFITGIVVRLCAIAVRCVEL